jgi:twitching motility protein PilT
MPDVSAPSGPVPIDKLLSLVVKQDASDLHLSVGRPPTIRINGTLRSLKLPPLTPEDTKHYAEAILPKRNRDEVEAEWTTDFGMAFGDVARFRTSVFKQKGVFGVVLRLIPSKLRSFDEIGLPHSVKNLLTRPRGIVLVTGPTGSGKTTTLATMIDFINREHDRHIITVEDPIEYYHEHQRSIITQREVHVDVLGFSEALRRGLRQDPDVMLVGEMRDLETITAAITAAETGHLVFATLHTTGSARTVDRIIDVYPKDQQEQIRTQLSVTILAVISQVLCQRADGEGRIAGFEIMIMNPAIENLIRENKTYRIPDVIQTSKGQGMVLLDEFLYNMYLRKDITFQELMQKCEDTAAMTSRIKEAKEAAARRK